MKQRVYEEDGLLLKKARSLQGEDQVERAVVIKALFRKDRYLEEPLSEIMSLAETAGAEVVEVFSQNLERSHPATYLGKGKIDEIASQLDQLEVDLVIADNDLSPAQERNLEKVFKRKVIDRSQVILDIFARRASTVQAKLQVELAQLHYTYPRLKRMWTHLERFDGGIGMRGPGETQLESDKRIIQKRIQRLKRKLDDIEKRQKVTIRQRPSDFVVALVGYTNVGKSTLLNKLTGSEELVEDKLFATLDTRTRKWRIDGNRHILLKDTVGFIRQLPHHLVASFHATLAETQNADLLFHVVDASSSSAERQITAVLKVLKRLECEDKPTWLVLNKWDQVPEDRRAEARGLERAAGNVIKISTVSAHSGFGLEELRSELLEFLRKQNNVQSLTIPHARGDLYAYIQRHGKVIEQESTDEGTEFKFEMAAVDISKLQSLYPEGFPPPEEEF